MKKISITLLILLIGCISYAQEKITQEQAVSLIAQYQERQIAAEKSMGEEKAKVDALKSEIAVLDAEIANLTSMMAGLKAAQATQVTEQKETGECTYYVVKDGDFLAKLAEYPEVYGRGNYALWPRIYHANKDQIKDPTLIYPGQRLRVPR